jgi:hypothetical protein
VDLTQPRTLADGPAVVFVEVGGRAGGLTSYPCRRSSLFLLQATLDVGLEFG